MNFNQGLPSQLLGGRWKGANILKFQQLSGWIPTTKPQERKSGKKCFPPTTTIGWWMSTGRAATFFSSAPASLWACIQKGPNAQKKRQLRNWVCPKTREPPKHTNQVLTKFKKKVFVLLFLLISVFISRRGPQRTRPLRAAGGCRFTSCWS